MVIEIVKIMMTNPYNVVYVIFFLYMPNIRKQIISIDVQRKVNVINMPVLTFLCITNMRKSCKILNYN